MGSENVDMLLIANPPWYVSCRMEGQRQKPKWHHLTGSYDLSTADYPSQAPTMFHGAVPEILAEYIYGTHAG